MSKASLPSCPIPFLLISPTPASLTKASLTKAVSMTPDAPAQGNISRFHTVPVPVAAALTPWAASVRFR
jgi:hypothetical protein